LDETHKFAWCHAGNSLANNVGASFDGGVHGIWMEADHKDGVSASSDKTLIGTLHQT
jgi:hypothetical protein